MYFAYLSYTSDHNLCVEVNMITIKLISTWFNMLLTIDQTQILLMLFSKEIMFKVICGNNKYESLSITLIYIWHGS